MVIDKLYSPYNGRIIKIVKNNLINGNAILLNFSHVFTMGHEPVIEN